MTAVVLTSSLCAAIAGCAGVTAGGAESSDAGGSGAESGAPGGGDAGVAGVDSPRDAPARSDVKDAGARRDRDPGYIPDAFLGDPQCQKGQFLLCEDFEGAALDATKWNVLNQDVAGVGKVVGTVDPTRAARGRGAFRLTLTRQVKADINYGLEGYLSSKMTFPVAGTDLYIRTFIFLDGKAPNHHINVLRVNSTEKMANGDDWNYWIDANNLNQGFGGPLQYWEGWGNGYQHGKSATADAAIEIPQGKWSCWEWEIHGATNQLVLWVNEQRVLNINSSAGWTAPPRATVDLRLFGGVASVDGEYSVWYDEVAIDDKRIGCTR